MLHGEHMYDNEHAYEDDLPMALGKLRCLRCGDKGVGLHERPCKTQRRYPWGDDGTVRDVLCVTESHGFYGGGSTAPLAVSRCTACKHVCNWRTHVARSTRLPPHDDPWIACCQACSRDGVPHEEIPARAGGASWCGAQDMAGNVWEWRSDGSALGGSFRTEGGPQLHQPISRRLAEVNGLPWSGSRDDIGFRVAISATEIRA